MVSPTDSGRHLPGIALTGAAACITALAFAAALKRYRISVSIKIERRRSGPDEHKQPKAKQKVFLCDKAVQYGLPLGQLENGDPEIHEFRNIGRLFSVFFNKRGVPR